MASLGIWKVKTLPGAGANGSPLFQVMRNEESVGEPFIFKGHAVTHKTRWMREEGRAVQQQTRASYEKGKTQ